MILLQFVFPYCSSIHCLLFHTSIVICIHVYARAHSLILHTHWEFSDSPRFAHPGIWVFLLLNKYLRRSCVSEEFGVSFAWSIGFFSTVHVFLFILLIPLIPYRLDSILFYLIHRIMSSCVEIYMLYCSDFIAFIINWYNLLRLL